APKSNELLELRCDLFCLQLCVQLRLVNLLNRDKDFTTGARRNVSFQLVDLRSLPTDDDAGTRSVDDDLQAIRRALDVDVRHACAGKALFEIAFQLQIFNQKIAELPFHKPMRMPVFVVAEAKAVCMNFLAQFLLQSGILNLEFKMFYSSVFFSLLSALPSLAAALLAVLLAFFCGFSSAAGASALFASGFAARFRRGAAAAPPRF